MSSVWLCVSARLADQSMHEGSISWCKFMHLCIVTGMGKRKAATCQLVEYRCSCGEACYGDCQWLLHKAAAHATELRTSVQDDRERIQGYQQKELPLHEASALLSSGLFIDDNDNGNADVCAGAPP
jgi:hypothetical protein